MEGMDEDVRDTVAFMIDSGTYGTRRHLIEGELKSPADPSRIGFWKKTKYVLRRIFPNTEFYYLHFPVTQRHKILIPLCWCYRFFRAAFRKPGRLFAEWKTVMKTK